jgi:hypothetical protein
MTILFGVVFALIALGLTAYAAWLLDGWVDTGSFWLLALVFISALLFVGFGFVALVAFGFIIGALFSFIGTE